MSSAALRELEGDIALAAGYLARAVMPEGRFRYRVHPARGPAPLRGYNVLRHAGAVYALGRYLEGHFDPAHRAAMLRAATYLKDCCLGPVPDLPGAAALWSNPAVTGRRPPPVAKLGGAGLGLAALGTIERMVPQFTSISDLRAMARFIVYMQKADGSFHSKYVPSAGGRRDDWTSLYYPGEAALGLLVLYDLDPSETWLNGAARALHYLAQSRRHLSEVPADHWALIASEKLARLAAEADSRVDEAALARHADQIIATLLREQIQSSPVPQRVGGFSPDGRTTPTATRLEGLVAVAKRLGPAQDPRYTEIRRSSAMAVQFLRRALIRSGEYAGGVTRAVRRLPPDGTEARDRFNRRAGEIRIDYVQHALSGFVEYARMERRARAMNHCTATMTTRDLALLPDPSPSGAEAGLSGPAAAGGEQTK